ncbi:strigolactones hydrolase CXE15 [Silene latifolia]|uniref:strigolactones hydrolase CXE15 n=1 Tax=Silene latifolia TaxID=37657 RepID=UPI003D77BF52
MGSLSQPDVVEDCFGVLKLYDNGSIHRVSDSDINFEKYNFENDTIGEGCDVEFEDCIFDDIHQLYLRVYRPCSTSKNVKMPILYFIHGGGFCLGSRTWPNCHNYCLRLSSQLHAVVIAPDYRLAPEHRLPAAIEDGLNAVKWLQLQAKLREEGDYCNERLSTRLIEDGVDFSKVFIIGDSSGGNIAHHLAVHFGSGLSELHPVQIHGYVLLGPFFGGLVRTISEAEGPPEPALDLDSLDRFWRLSLPIGESQDHPSANPFGPNSPSLEKTLLDPILVIAGESEIMKDRIKDYASRLKKLGKDITYVEFEGEHHGFYLHKSSSLASSQLFTLLKRFIMAN